MPSPVKKHRPKDPKVPNDPGLLTKKKRKDKARWVAAEEAAIIATLLTQKAASNVSESASSHQCGLWWCRQWLGPLQPG